MSDFGVTDEYYARNTKQKQVTQEKSKHEIENKRLISNLQGVIELSNDLISFMKYNSFESKLDEQFLSEYLQVINAKLYDAKQAINNKQKIELYQQYLLYQTFANLGVSAAAKLYRTKIKDYSKLTAKQVKKFLAGTTTNLLDIFTVHTPYEATANGYYGTYCMSCNSLRVSLVDSDGVRKLHCWACHIDSTPPDVILPKMAS